MAKLCFYCSKPATIACLHCHLIQACSEEHLNHFHRPGNFCFPFKICRSTSKGLHVIAVRDIKPMEVILSEWPCAAGPYMKTKPQCLNCFLPLGLLEGHPYQCSKCGFPLCQQACESGQLHQLECHYLQKSGFRPDIKDLNAFDTNYVGITALKIILLKGSLIYFRLATIKNWSTRPTHSHDKQWSLTIFTHTSVRSSIAKN